MTANIFISFASKDVKMAMTLCTALENRGYKCWISARDIQPGENFQVAIVQAIRHAKIMLLVFTGNSNNSEEMTKELALASQQKMIVIPLRVEDVTPSDAFAYEFATRQWIDFFADWEFAIEQLARRIANALRERSVGLETNDVAGALTEVAATAPVAYTIEPPQTPEPPKSEPPKNEPKAPVQAEAPSPAKPAEPARPAGPAAKTAEPPKAPPPEPITEVRKQVLEHVAPSAAAKGAAGPAPSAAKASAKAAEPAKPAAAKPRSEPRADAQDGEKRGMSGRTLALIAGVVVVVLTGIGLTLPRLLQQKPAAPAEAAAPPPAPTVVHVSAPAPVVPEPVPAVNAPAAIAPAAAATNATATNAIKTTPRKKAAAATTQAPKDDIPF